MTERHRKLSNNWKCPHCDNPEKHYYANGMCEACNRVAWRKKKKGVEILNKHEAAKSILGAFDHGTVVGNRNEDREFIPVVPMVGMGVTKLCFTDRIPYTITRIIKGPNSLSIQALEIQEDQVKAIHKDIYKEPQRYEYTADPDGSKLIITLRKNGKWYARGSSTKSERFIIGERRKYHDLSF